MLGAEDMHVGEVQAKAVSNGSVVGRPEGVPGPQGAKVSGAGQLDSARGHSASFHGGLPEKRILRPQQALQRKKQKDAKKVHPPYRCKTVHRL